MRLRDLFRRTCRECRGPIRPGWARSDEYRASGWCPRCLGLDTPPSLAVPTAAAGGPSIVEARGDGLWGVRCGRDGCDFLEVIRGVPDDMAGRALAILRDHHATAHQDDENPPQEAAPTTGGTRGHRAPGRPAEPPTRPHQGANHDTPTDQTPHNTRTGEPNMPDHDPTADQVTALQAQVDNAQRYAADLEVRLEAAEKVQTTTEALAREKDAHLASQDRHLDTMRAYAAHLERLTTPPRFVTGPEAPDDVDWSRLAAIPDTSTIRGQSFGTCVADLEDALGGIDTGAMDDDLAARWSYLLDLARRAVEANHAKD